MSLLNQLAERFGLSQPVLRVEDPRLLSGRGRYIDDVVLPAQCFAVILRSPHAHARIHAIRTEAARAAPGVLGVFTAADLRAAGIAPIRCPVPLKNRDGTPRADPPRYPLAEGYARHVGDPVALLVAESLLAARDAAERVEIDYEALPPAVSPAAAVEANAPQVWDEAPGNLCFDWERGDAARTTALFAGAAHIARLELISNRLVANPLEPRGANASFDAASGRWSITVASQGPFVIRNGLAQSFGLPPERFRVTTEDVGGGFGIKLYMYPEYVLVAFAARALGRPVKWVPDRGESFLCDVHGRDHLSRAELALDRDGAFLALRVDTLANMGAYLSSYAPLIPSVLSTQVLPSVYRLRAVHARVRGVFTHTAPVDAYRGSGRPEAHYLVERLIDVAARELAIDRVELRRRNLVSAREMPWTNAFGISYDSGDFPALLARALEASSWADFATRRDSSRAQGRRRGIGLACYIEATGGSPHERAELRFDAEGFVSVLVGTQSTGQGHETAYTQLVAARLGISPERIRIVQGDTDVLKSGGGTGGSRSLYTQGGALVAVIARVIDRGRAEAARRFECAANDVEFGDGAFKVAGTDRHISLLDLGAQASAPLDEAADFSAAANTYPNGCHIAEVELDEDTGAMKIVRYTVVDDMGTIINPPIVEGQIAGGAVQGIGQAALELARYDESGQLSTGSFMDYALPRADDLPPIDVVLQGVPCTTNPLGVKGAGEAGAIGAPPAVVNAIVDALADLGVLHLDMPVQSERIWRALQTAQPT